MLHVTHANHLLDYKIAVTFSDGRSGVADLKESLDRGVFLALKNTALFAQFRVDPELQTVCWSGGQDLAPEYLYFKAFEHDPAFQERFKNWGYLK